MSLAGLISRPVLNQAGDEVGHVADQQAKVHRGETYPLVTRIAGSLCKLIDDPSKRATAPMSLVDAHIDAIKASVKGGIQTDTHPVGHALVTELEQQVKDFAAG